MTYQAIELAIKRFAAAYANLEQLQKEHPTLIPRGDQKVGPIGEYYAMKFARRHFGRVGIFGGHSEKGWDIEIQSEPAVRIQVKTVSAFSAGRALSPVKPGWDELWLLSLNPDFFPDGFWIVPDPSLIPNEKKGLKCPHIDSRFGSRIFYEFRRNRIAELAAALE